MAILDGFSLESLPGEWQGEANHWQDTYFPELPETQDIDNWQRFYPNLKPTNLSVIMAEPDKFAQFASRVVGASTSTADLGWRVRRAEEMNDQQFDLALRIIRAQASTELGSIQQHRMVYLPMDSGSLTGIDKEIVEGIHTTGNGHDLDFLSFSSKRVCVEELRHHYQMGGVLTLDRTWDERHGRRYGSETMEELFAMKPGEHVLDAFNIEFKSLLDTATFLALIDRVGKYQLEMQHHFLYAPMALSMPFMRWMEESYHLAAGERLMKAIAVAATLDGGNFGIDELQKTVNMWYPRGMEMFGSELSGQHVKGIFKTLGNAEAQAIYSREVKGKVRDINLRIIQAEARCDRKRAKQILNRIEAKGERVHGLGQGDLLRVPDRRFFRFRGLTEFADYRERDPETGRLGYVYLPYDLDGHLLTRAGARIEREEYVEYLRTVLPERYMGSRHWRDMREEFLFNARWGGVGP